MIMHLIFLDLAAKACPKQAEGTFFALLMSVFNGGSQISNITGGWLYGQMGFTTLILISAASTALCWLLVPLLKVGGGASQPGTDSVVSLVPAAS
jgi:predicted MFS family arabinose efflux permease